MIGHNPTAALRSFVNELDRFDRLVLLMYYVDGLTAAEIAAVLNWSDGRVAKTLSQLRSQAERIIHEHVSPTPSPKSPAPLRATA